MNYNLKNKKAQIMVLDVMFTIVLIILLFFLLFRWAEMKTYQSVSDRKTVELNYISKTAFMSLTENHSINCYAFDSDNKYLVSSCFGSDSVISKTELGIPVNYNCNFSIAGFALATNECVDVLPADSNNYFSMKFNVITNTDRYFPKNIYLENILGKPSSTDLSEKEATWVIWK
jgi:hypothetical protein